MRPRIAIATCAEHPGLDLEAGLLQAALRDRGADAAPAVWSEPPDGGWEAYDAVIVRCTWDYPSSLDAFVQWVHEVGPRLYNAPDAIVWNTNKHYLLDLERAGIRPVATVVLAPGDPFAPPAARYVVKPAVSLGSQDAAVYDGDRAAAARAHVLALHAEGRAVLVQPHLASVDSEGETAVVFLDGTVSHCMRKGPLLVLDQAPVDGLYRAEDMRRREPDADVLALARATFEVVRERFGAPLYARVDILRTDDGEPAVLEVELIEPSLFLDFAAGSADVLAQALLRRAGLPVAIS